MLDISIIVDILNHDSRDCQPNLRSLSVVPCAFGTHSSADLGTTQRWRTMCLRVNRSFQYGVNHGCHSTYGFLKKLV
jgi:hypothetical protein